MCAGIYLLGSEEDTYLTEKQLQKMQACVARNGWKTVHVYRDTAPVVKKDRPAFRKMMKDAQQHRFDRLLFWSLDQLQHGARKTTLLLNNLSSWGIGFCSCTEPHINTCHERKDTVIAVLASLAQQDSAHISERTRAGLERQQITRKPGPHGRLGPGRPPVEFNQERAKALRAKNKSYDQIAMACGISKATIQRFFKSMEKPNS
jgi:site-specific DNA recombinase